MKSLLGLASLATMVVACWLFTVIAFVLPSRDPMRIPLWTGVAVAFAIYGGLCIAYLAVGSLVRALQVAVSLLSLGAIGLGGWGVAKMLTADTRHFEGYLLLMGLILTTHGIIALAFTARSKTVTSKGRLPA